jgi:hypothetical protein
VQHEAAAVGRAERGSRERDRQARETEEIVDGLFWVEHRAAINIALAQN